MGMIFLAIVAALVAIETVKSRNATEIQLAINSNRVGSIQPNQTKPNQEVKLIGGSTPSEGNVYLINSDNKLAPACHWGWGGADATVVCRQLGYAYGIPTVESTFGSVPKDLVLDRMINCNGDEARIQDCPYWPLNGCSEGAGVICVSSNVSVLLRGGSTTNEGNVYAVNSENNIGPICDDGWGDADSRVVCRQLGYADGVATKGSLFGRVEKEFAMDEVNCSGDEALLQDCSYRTKHDCWDYEGAGVWCSYFTLDHSQNASKSGEKCECNGANGFKNGRSYGECKDEYITDALFCFVDATSVCLDKKRPESYKGYNRDNEESKKFYSHVPCYQQMDLAAAQLDREVLLSVLIIDKLQLNLYLHSYR